MAPVLHFVVQEPFCLSLVAKGLMLMDWYLLGLVVGLGYHCYTDVSYLLLYDSTNILLALLGLWRAWHLGLMSEAWQGAVVLGIMMLIIYCVSCGGMGEGDVKLAAVLGLWLGVEQGILCLLLAFVSGAVCGCILVVLKYKNSKQALPFGPYLAMSAIICYVYGEAILRWYGQFLH